MLPIAAMLHLVSPLVAGNRHLAAFRLYARLAFHLLLGLFIGGAAYLGTLLAVVTIYPPRQAAANLVYSVGFAGASLLAVWVVTVVTPVSLGRIAIATAATLAATLPLMLVVTHTIANDGRMLGCLWYLVGSLAGGSVGTRLLAPADGPGGGARPRPPMSTIRPAV